MPELRGCPCLMLGAGPSCNAYQFGIQGQPTMSSGCSPFEVGGVSAGASILWGRATVVRKMQEKCGCESEVRLRELGGVW